MQSGVLPKQFARRRLRFRGSLPDRPLMPNRDTQKSWEYHNATKHSSWSIHNNPHFLDWPNQPIPFKIYSDLEPIALPQEFSDSTVPALAAIGTGVHQWAVGKRSPEAQAPTRELFGKDAALHPP